MFLSIYLLFSLLCEFVCVKKSPSSPLFSLSCGVDGDTSLSIQRGAHFIERKGENVPTECGKQEERRQGRWACIEIRKRRTRKKIIFCEK